MQQLQGKIRHWYNCSCFRILTIASPGHNPMNPGQARHVPVLRVHGLQGCLRDNRIHNHLLYFSQGMYNGVKGQFLTGEQYFFQNTHIRLRCASVLRGQADVPAH